MEGIFTLPYSEYEVMNQIQNRLKKSEGNSFYIPASRQQKGIDLIIHNNEHNKILRFQVKSSRTYEHRPKQLKSGKLSTPKYQYNLWFNNFVKKYKENTADYYVLFGLYPSYNQEKKIDSKHSIWESLILCFSEKEMFNILKNVKTKRKKNMDMFFGFGFNNCNEVYGTRGFSDGTNVSEFLLDNKIDELRNRLKE